MKELLHDVKRVIDRRLARRFVALSVVSVLVAGLDVLGIALLVPLIDDLAGQSGSTTVLSLPVISDLSTGALLGLVVGFFIAKSLSMAGLRWWATGAIQHSAADTATRLFAAYMAAPMDFHDRRNSAGSIRAVANTVPLLFGSGFTAAASGIAESATLVVLAVFVVIVSPIPAIVGAVYLGVAAWVFLRVLQPRTKVMALRAQDLSTEAVQSVSEGLGGLREHRVRHSEAGLVVTFAEQRRRQAGAQRFTSFVAELPRYYLEVLVLGGFGVIAAVILRTTSGPESLVTLGLLLAVIFRVLPSMARLLSVASSLKVGQAALDLILVDLDDMGIDRLAKVRLPKPLPEHDGASEPLELSLHGVSFRYVSDDDNGAAESLALRDVSVVVAPGRSLGVVGPSGAGKSTLIDVVCGIRTPTSGDVRVGGRPLDDSIVEWRRRVGLVPQDVYLIDGPIRRNVAFGLTEDDDRVWEALSRAQLADFVRKMPDGIDTIVGERGTRLSGGQRQRLGIARALYGNPSVLVLDEATAALDVETEAAVVEAVGALSGELSLIVVAHRLSTIRWCDAVAYLEDGSVRAVGTFDEVADAVPEFERAVRLAGIDRRSAS